MRWVCPFLIFFLPNARDRRQWKGGLLGLFALFYLIAAGRMPNATSVSLFNFFLPNGRDQRQWKGAILLPCRPMPHTLPPPLMTSTFLIIHLLPPMTAWFFIILFWTDECDWRQQGRRRRPTTTRRRGILPWHCLFRLCHYQCCIFIPHQRQQWLRGDDFFFGFFISTILCLSLYLLPYVASKHLTIGFIISTKFQIGHCWLLSVTDSNSGTKSLR